MYLGRFVEEGETEAIFTAPHHPYTAALLSANPEPDPDKVHDRIALPAEVPSLLDRPSGCEFHTRCPFCARHLRVGRPHVVGRRRQPADLPFPVECSIRRRGAHRNLEGLSAMDDIRVVTEFPRKAREIEESVDSRCRTA